MKNETLKLWPNTYDLSPSMDVEAVNYHSERLEILLRGEGAKKTLKITFEFPLSFRTTRESYFFNAFDDWEVKHYAIYTSLDCIDVLSSHPPLLDWVQ